jgi:hypothetical protein
VLTKYEELLGPQRNLSYCQWIYQNKKEETISFESRPAPIGLTKMPLIYAFSNDFVVTPDSAVYADSKNEIFNIQKSCEIIFPDSSKEYPVELIKEGI